MPRNKANIGIKLLVGTGLTVAGLFGGDSLYDNSSWGEDQPRCSRPLDWNDLNTTLVPWINEQTFPADMVHDWLTNDICEAEPPQLAPDPSVPAALGSITVKYEGAA